MWLYLYPAAPASMRANGAEVSRDLRGCGSHPMSGRRLNRIVAGTALALVFAVGGAVAAASQDEKAIEALIPVPDMADVPPPTAADVTGTVPSRSSTEPAGAGERAAPAGESTPAAATISPAG